MGSKLCFLFEFYSVYDFCCCVLHPIIKSYFYDACNSVASYISDKIYITRKVVRRNIIQFTSFQGTKTTYVRILCHNNNVFKVSVRIQPLSIQLPFVYLNYIIYYNYYTKLLSEKLQKYDIIHSVYIIR